ncbi:hypothetical protein A5N15_11490 [Rothia kristinae]|uniref:Uncharacterized protein n=1 Tax=Rothia kristinae TaxID=37923 RepID=A0A657IVC9_9MICC|nr:hypothetical protein A5N15_11490 [Rothia kristinae]
MEAILAMNLLEATPIEATSPVRWRIRVRMPRAMRTGEPRRRCAPVTSRKASSTLTCSTRSVTSCSTAMICRE